MAQGSRKLGNPWTQNAFWPARGRSYRRCGCACRRGGFLYLLLLFHILILMLLSSHTWWLYLLRSSLWVFAILSISKGGRVLPGTRWVGELWLRARPGWWKQKSESCRSAENNGKTDNKATLWGFVSELWTKPSKKSTKIMMAIRNYLQGIVNMYSDAWYWYTMHDWAR